MEYLQILPQLNEILELKRGQSLKFVSVDILNFIKNERGQLLSSPGQINYNDELNHLQSLIPIPLLPNLSMDDYLILFKQIFSNFVDLLSKNHDIRVLRYICLNLIYYLTKFHEILRQSTIDDWRRDDSNSESSDGRFDSSKKFSDLVENFWNQASHTLRVCLQNIVYRLGINVARNEPRDVDCSNSSTSQSTPTTLTPSSTGSGVQGNSLGVSGTASTSTISSSVSSSSSCTITSGSVNNTPQNGQNMNTSTSSAPIPVKILTSKMQTVPFQSSAPQLGLGSNSYEGNGFMDQKQHLGFTISMMKMLPPTLSMDPPELVSKNLDVKSHLSPENVPTDMDIFIDDNDAHMMQSMSHIDPGLGFPEDFTIEKFHYDDFDSGAFEDFMDSHNGLVDEMMDDTIFNVEKQVNDYDMMYDFNGF